jgi:hypothetical protein
LSSDDAAAPGAQQPLSCLKDQGVVVDHDDKLGDWCTAGRFHDESLMKKTPDHTDTLDPEIK